MTIRVCRMLRSCSVFIGLVATSFGIARGDDYRLVHPDLKLVTIDTDKTESFLSMAVDGTGRLFVGGREALFVYEPIKGGLYGSRQLLYRFPKDTWIYDVVIRGHDLYVLTTAALYEFPDGALKREGLQPRRLLWGMPVAHVHQGLHGLIVGPDGDLYISQGDQLWYYGDYKRNPDHWGHWTLFHGPDNTPTPYTGDGGVLQLSPDGRQLHVIANGTRNDCGLAFDAQWNLFGNDNDHESIPSAYVPGRLLHITPHAYFNWPRGWMLEKQPWRSDLLDTLTPNLGRYVPVGVCYYDDGFLPSDLRGSLYVPEWGSHKVAQYPLRRVGDTFKTDERLLMSGEGQARPVGVAVGRGGRMFVTICYMDHNETSPIYRSDLVMITRADDGADAPFASFDQVAATTERLLGELDSADWSRRYRAHVELTRRGADATKAAAARLDSIAPGKAASVHLIWLAAADGNPQTKARIVALARHPDEVIRSTAVRALARFGAPADVFLSALNDSSPGIRHAALIGLFDQTDTVPFEPVVSAAIEEHSFIRQTAAFLLARRASVEQIRSLCDSPQPGRRRAGVLAAGFRLTVPQWDSELDPNVPLSPHKGAYHLTYAGDVQEDLTRLGRIGDFSMAEAWAARQPTADDAFLYSLLNRRTQDSDINIAKQAALFVRLLSGEKSPGRVSELLGTPSAAPADPKAPIAGARAADSTVMPEEFRRIDWSKEAAKGDVNAGEKLFVSRGCANCHAIRVGEAGGGAPSLTGVGSRFSVDYIVESIVLPNKVVAPEFRWTVTKLKSGDVINGLVTSETATDVEFLLPTGLHQTLRRADIADRRIEDRSPMPEGLIQTPAELRDLVAYLASIKQ